MLSMGFVGTAPFVFFDTPQTLLVVSQFPTCGTRCMEAKPRVPVCEAVQGATWHWAGPPQLCTTHLHQSSLTLAWRGGARLPTPVAGIPAVMRPGRGVCRGHGCRGGAGPHGAWPLPMGGQVMSVAPPEPVHRAMSASPHFQRLLLVPLVPCFCRCQPQPQREPEREPQPQPQRQSQCQRQPRCGEGLGTMGGSDARRVSASHAHLLSVWPQRACRSEVPSGGGSLRSVSVCVVGQRPALGRPLAVPPSGCG